MRTIQLALPDGSEIGCLGVLFDMDGVLVDSLAIIERHLYDWAVGHGLDPHHVIGVSPGRTNGELVAQVAPFLNASAEAERLVQREITDTAGITACPGAARLVAAMPAGSWAVVTSGHRPVALARLTAADLPIPDILITADDVRAGKPDPEGYRRAAALLGVRAADCVVIEDAAAGLAAARAAGMRSIAIEPAPGALSAPGGPRLGDHSLSSLDLLGISVRHPEARPC